MTELLGATSQIVRKLQGPTKMSNEDLARVKTTIQGINSHVGAVRLVLTGCKMAGVQPNMGALGMQQTKQIEG